MLGADHHGDTEIPVFWKTEVGYCCQFSVVGSRFFVLGCFWCDHLIYTGVGEYTPVTAGGATGH